MYESDQRDVQAGTSQQRALLVLIAAALLASGVLFSFLPDRPSPSLESEPIVLENVVVIVPLFTEPGRVNVNTATAAELVRLPGIGEALAARIIAYREAHGPFATLDALAAVRGIGPQTVDEIRASAEAE
jgi:competence ComEA-like helix-hairpin-helix protein